MRWKKYGVEMDMTGITRKAVAEILAEQFDTKVVFCLSFSVCRTMDITFRIKIKGCGVFFPLTASRQKNITEKKWWEQTICTK